MIFQWRLAFGSQVRNTDLQGMHQCNCSLLKQSKHSDVNSF
ncbi:hypothetical protein MtrunA17_Chr5g0427981 [Medicago truncatula]|uniref:Uncharacterized protein n=1 Tax=Medicago truncatula TaxID=3880 RepID=A0A396HUT2_MEDTR|nr:hypothetical protein MtrunA17_Chr5g0427981 [Medicago truncatula]